jgi:D-alanine transaminase
MPDPLYVNGRFTTTDERVLGVEDRGFQFGDAIYEVFKFLGRRPVLMSDHFRRLEGNLRALEIPQPFEEAAFAGIARELIARTRFDDGILYTQITRGEAPRAHFWPEGIAPTVVMHTRRFVFPDAARREQGARLITTEDRRWRDSDLKTVNLLANAMAKKKAQRAGADEALLLAEGFVREGASSNFFAVKNGGLVTHPLDGGILPGIVRDHVIRLALRERIRVDERPLREAELYDLDEAFLTSTTQSVMPIASIDGRPMARGPVGARLNRLFEEVERQSAADAGAS